MLTFETDKNTLKEKAKELLNCFEDGEIISKFH